MIIVCNKCNTRYKLDDGRVKKPEFGVRCVKCGHVFRVKKEAQKAEVAPVKMPVPDFEPSACKVISVCNQKGGVAKTTTCLNLGASLSQLNKRVLLIDFDVQSNLSLLLGFNDSPSFFEASNSSDSELSKYIVKTKYDFCLLPSNSNMTLLSKKHLPDENFGYMLRAKLNSIKAMFDYIIIDTPPSGDFYTLNALLASDFALSPAQCEYLSMNGVTHIKNMIDVIEEKTGHAIKHGVVATMYDESSTTCNVILGKMKEQFSDSMCDTVIGLDAAIQESQILHEPITYYNDKSYAAIAYKDLASEVVGRLPCEI